jgi:hypothetical protein
MKWFMDDPYLMPASFCVTEGPQIITLNEQQLGADQFFDDADFFDDGDKIFPAAKQILMETWAERGQGHQKCCE